MTSLPPEDRSPADRLLVPAGLLTVLVGALPVGIELWARTGFAEVRDALWLAGVLGFAVAFLLGTRGGGTPFRCLLFVVLQTVLALGTAVAKPWEFAGILLVVAAAQYGTLLKLPHSLLVCVGQTAALTAILVAHGRDPARATIGMSMLFMFQVFALLTANVAARESEGRIALAEANAELVEAQGRLALASREAERLRIARDLHDVLGHRLTGLTLALETSRHLLARGETAPAAEQVERASTAARALLADVRQVVSSLREDDDGPVDLAPALRALAARFEGLQV
ncbi:MAG: hypothetical protein JNK60_08965, partial [Acidobacteria bacterium]|nr:hypothetical protein [Acidobacteriota bacterium]